MVSKRATTSETVGKEATQFHSAALVFDSLLFDYVVEDPYLDSVLAGGVKAGFYDFVGDSDWDIAIKKLEVRLDRIERHPRLALATSAAEIETITGEGKLALVLGCQSAAFVGEHLWRLALLHRLGLRWIQLTYSFGELYGDGCAEPRDAGLTFLGRDFIERTNELGILLDLSHCGHRTTEEAIELARAPVFTHANSYSVNGNDRNKKDQSIKAVVAKGGMIGICGLPASVRSHRPTLDDWLDHLDYLVGLVGWEHVGVGTDYMEKYKGQKIIPAGTKRNRTLRPDIFGTIEDFLEETYPIGVETPDKLPNLTRGLFNRGYSKEQVQGILGLNWLRTVRQLVI